MAKKSKKRKKSAAASTKAGAKKRAAKAAPKTPPTKASGKKLATAQRKGRGVKTGPTAPPAKASGVGESKKSSGSRKKAPGSRRRRVDPDRLVELERERDELLLSITDLEREFEAGDLDEADYRTLRDGYTARTASVLRSIEGHQDSVAESKKQTSPQRLFMTTAMVGVFALIVGIFLARTLGERGVDDALSGSIDTSRRDQVIECRRLGEDGDLVASLECYDGVLEVDPTNTDALTYRGWFRILQVDTLTDAGQAETAEQLLTLGQRDLNFAIEIDPTVPDAFAFRSVVHSRLGRSEAACEDIASLVALDPPQFYLTQTTRIAESNNCQAS